jgi:hypothetical protein
LLIFFSSCCISCFVSFTYCSFFLPPNIRNHRPLCIVRNTYMSSSNCYTVSFQSVFFSVSRTRSVSFSTSCIFDNYIMAHPCGGKQDSQKNFCSAHFYNRLCYTNQL